MKSPYAAKRGNQRQLHFIHFCIVIFVTVLIGAGDCAPSRNLKIDLHSTSPQSPHNNHPHSQHSPAHQPHQGFAPSGKSSQDPVPSTPGNVATHAATPIAAVAQEQQQSSQRGSTGVPATGEGVTGTEPKSTPPQNNNPSQQQEQPTPQLHPNQPQPTPNHPPPSNQQPHPSSPIPPPQQIVTAPPSTSANNRQQKIQLPSTNSPGQGLDGRVEGRGEDGGRIWVTGVNGAMIQKSKVAAAVALNNNFVTGSLLYNTPTLNPNYPSAYTTNPFYSRLPFNYQNPIYQYPYTQTYYQQIQPQQQTQQPQTQQQFQQQQPQTQPPQLQPQTQPPTQTQTQPQLQPQTPTNNIIISSNSPTTITTTNKPDGTTVTTITPVATTPTSPAPPVLTSGSGGDSFNSQITNNLINNIFTYLLPKNDPNIYNTGPSEKVYEIKNIDLNVTNLNTTGAPLNATGPVNIITTVNSNSVNTQQPANTTSTPTTTNSTTPILTQSGSFDPNTGTVLPLTPVTDPTPPPTPTPTLTPNTTDSNTTINTTINSTTSSNNSLTKTPLINGTITGKLVPSVSTTNTDSRIKFKYEEYLAKYKPNVLTQNPSDLTVYRQTIFNLNINTINQHNANPNKSYEVGVNLFTDLTLDQFNRQFAKLVVPDSVKNQAIVQAAAIQSQGKPVFTVPPSIFIDWSCKASPAISQGVCGACYAIAAAQSISMTKRMRGISVNFLSIQEVISCGVNFADLNGCLGGYFSGAYNYCKNFGIGQSSLYYYDDKAKYEGILSNCDDTFVKNTLYLRSKQFIKAGVRIRFGDCQQIVKQLQFRVLTVSIAAYGFQFYTSGVFSTSNKFINHGVTLVGYNPANKSYLIKNSWGATWGQLGYGYIDESTSLCHYAMYPELSAEEEQKPIEKCLDRKIPIPDTAI